MSCFIFQFNSPNKNIELGFDVGDSEYRISVLGQNKGNELKHLLKSIFFAPQHAEVPTIENSCEAYAELPIGTFERAIQRIIALETQS